MKILLALSLASFALSSVSEANLSHPKGTQPRRAAAVLEASSSRAGPSRAPLQEERRDPTNIFHHLDFDIFERHGKPDNRNFAVMAPSCQTWEGRVVLILTKWLYQYLCLERCEPVTIPLPREDLGSVTFDAPALPPALPKPSKSKNPEKQRKVVKEQKKGLLVRCTNLIAPLSEGYIRLERVIPSERIICFATSAPMARFLRTLDGPTIDSTVVRTWKDAALQRVIWDSTASMIYTSVENFMYEQFSSFPPREREGIILTSMKALSGPYRKSTEYNEKSDNFKLLYLNLVSKGLISHDLEGHFIDHQREMEIYTALGFSLKEKPLPPEVICSLMPSLKRHPKTGMPLNSLKERANAMVPYLLREGSDIAHHHLTRYILDGLIETLPTGEAPFFFAARFLWKPNTTEAFKYDLQMLIRGIKSGNIRHNKQGEEVWHDVRDQYDGKKSLLASVFHHMVENNYLGREYSLPLGDLYRSGLRIGINQEGSLIEISDLDAFLKAEEYFREDPSQLWPLYKGTYFSPEIISQRRISPEEQGRLSLEALQSESAPYTRRNLLVNYLYDLITEVSNLTPQGILIKSPQERDKLCFELLKEIVSYSDGREIFHLLDHLSYLRLWKLTLDNFTSLRDHLKQYAGSFDGKMKELIRTSLKGQLLEEAWDEAYKKWYRPFLGERNQTEAASSSSAPPSEPSSSSDSEDLDQEEEEVAEEAADRASSSGALAESCLSPDLEAPDIAHEATEQESAEEGSASGSQAPEMPIEEEAPSADASVPQPPSARLLQRSPTKAERYAAAQKSRENRPEGPIHPGALSLEEKKALREQRKSHALAMRFLAREHCTPGQSWEDLTNAQALPYHPKIHFKDEAMKQEFWNLDPSNQNTICKVLIGALNGEQRGRLHQLTSGMAPNKLPMWSAKVDKQHRILLTIGDHKEIHVWGLLVDYH